MWAGSSREEETLYVQLRERERLTESFAVIGYPSDQDSAIVPARDNPLCPARK